MKVKIKSLAEEARIIRKEEKRVPEKRESLHTHRVFDVRNEALAALMAYAFIRGKKFSKSFPNMKIGPYRRASLHKRVSELISKYGLADQINEQYKDTGIPEIPLICSSSDRLKSIIVTLGAWISYDN